MVFVFKTFPLLNRYPPHGKRIPAIEEVPWERIRAPSVATSAHELHISDCLSDLHPGDHFEIQWRRNKDFPYGNVSGIVKFGNFLALSAFKSFTYNHDPNFRQTYHVTQHEESTILYFASFY